MRLSSICGLRGDGTEQGASSYFYYYYFIIISSTAASTSFNLYSSVTWAIEKKLLIYIFKNQYTSTLDFKYLAINLALNVFIAVSLPAVLWTLLAEVKDFRLYTITQLYKNCM